MKSWKKSSLAIAQLLAVGWLASAQTPPNPATTTNVIAESSVQYSATGATSFTNYVSGYNKIKWSGTQPCKSYFKFDFTGQRPNTNSSLKFTWRTFTNNQKQRAQLWVLDQAYPGFTTNNPSLTWIGAQANDTNAAATGMLTNGSGSTYTATYIDDMLIPGSVNTDIGVTLPAPWGQYLINNQVVIVLTATNDPVDGNSSNGGRLYLQNSAAPSFATFQPLTVGNLPPSISSIPAQTVRSTDNSSAIVFTVSDPEDAANTLTNITISLGNTNVTLTATNIAIGSGGSRTLTFTPVSNKAAGQTATVTVTLTLTDSAGNSATSAFFLTVPPSAPLPVLMSGTNVNYIPPTNLVGSGSVVIPFSIISTNVAASSLVVTGAVSSYSTNISSISFTSSTQIAPNTNSCTLTVNANGSGVGIVTIRVIDPANLVTNNVKVAVMVLPDSSYAVCDYMNYEPSSTYSGSARVNLFDGSANLWAARTTSGSVNLITSIDPNPENLPSGVPLIRGTSSGNQNQIRLAGAPYTAGSHKIVYASIMAQWADTSLWGTTAQYPGNSTGGFVQFAATGSSSGVSMAAVCTVTNSANTTNNNGLFHLGLYNGTNAPSVDTSLSLVIPNFLSGSVAPNPPVNVVIAYDVDTGVSTMWANQSSSAGSSVSLQEVGTTNLVNVNYLVLRQNANMGNILVSSAAVKVVTKPFPTVTGITKSGNVVISYTDAPGTAGTASVVGSSTVDGVYNPIAASINEVISGNYTATITPSGDQMFYRIKQTAGAPTVTFPF